MCHVFRVQNWESDVLKTNTTYVDYCIHWPSKLFPYDTKKETTTSPYSVLLLAVESLVMQSAAAILHFLYMKTTQNDSLLHNNHLYAYLKTNKNT